MDRQKPPQPPPGACRLGKLLNIVHPLIPGIEHKRVGVPAVPLEQGWGGVVTRHCDDIGVQLQEHRDVLVDLLMTPTLFSKLLSSP